MISVKINNYDNNFSKLTNEELFAVTEIIILYNKNTFCATSLIFEIFKRDFYKITEFNIWNIENTNLNRLTDYLEQLKQNGRFLKDKFRMLCYDLFENLENKVAIYIHIYIQILWWLDKNNIISIEEYWFKKPEHNVIAHLKLVMQQTVKGTDYINYKNIVCDIFIKIVLNLYSSKTKWSSKVENIFNKYLEEAINELILPSSPVYLIFFVKFLSNAPVFYENLIKNLYKDILQKLIRYNDVITINDAWVIQELLSTNNLPTYLVNIYFELLKQFSFEEICSIIEKIPIQYINWYFLLTLIGVFVNKTKDGFTILKNFMHRQLQYIFNYKTDLTNEIFEEKSSSNNRLLCVILFVRQACLEQRKPHQEYSDWYSNSFGVNTFLRTASNSESFSLLLNTLLEQIPYEPLYALNAHVDRSLRAPPGMQRNMLFFKDASRVRTEILTTSSSIRIGNKTLPVPRILDGFININKLPWALRNLNIRNDLLKFINDESEYNRIKELLISNGLVESMDQ